tara:strand:- start:592 stop:768 length:177 start_codon:yes stop_codon:yes gene_type:complete
MSKQQKIIDAVIDQIAKDVKIKDFTAIEEMLKQVLNQTFEPNTILKSYLPVAQFPLDD